MLTDTPGHYVRPSEPNVALLSFLLLVGTCVIALGLKKFRRSKFFGSYVRRTLSDVGILISILTMVCLDNFIESKTGIKTEVSIILLTKETIFLEKSFFSNHQRN